MKVPFVKWLICLAVLFAVAAVVSCAGGEPGAADAGDGGGDSDSDTDGDSDSDTDDVCAEDDLDLELAGVKAMLLVDSSSSMSGILFGENKWASAIEAVDTLVSDPGHIDTWFSLHVFPNFWLGFIPTCDTEPLPVIDLAQGNGTEIVEWMGDNSPGLLGLTPMLDGLEFYLGGAPTALHDPTTSNYIVLLSDGADNCYVPTMLQGYRKHNLLAGISDDLKDAVGIKTIAVGFGDEVAEEELEAVAANGGTSFDTYIAASDGTQLEEAFEEIAKSIRPCKYLLPPPDAAWDSIKVNFYFDGELVERDRSHVDGWDWTKSDELEVEFHGPACEQIKDGTVGEVTATFGCPTQIDGEVCATYESFLPFPDVAVMILLDYSGSMTGSKWRAATTAITNMLVDDRNNHVEFGFDPFPSEGACGVSEWPMFTIGGQLNHLPIIKWAAEHDTFLGGMTPIHAVLERLILRPGELAESDKTGVVVVITDGGDSCYEPEDEVADALYETVALAVDMHDIRVFAIGYGEDASEEQLDAIAQAGGTGLDTFMQANSEEDLEDLFDQISKMVTSCLFNVPNPGADVDYEQVNIYFDGEVVPRDVTHSDGWDWYNPVTKTKVEFYGSYCQKLKDGEVTDVIIEFGCETVGLE